MWSVSPDLSLLHIAVNECNVEKVQKLLLDKHDVNVTCFHVSLMISILPAGVPRACVDLQRKCTSLTTVGQGQHTQGVSLTAVTVAGSFAIQTGMWVQGRTPLHHAAASDIDSSSHAEMQAIIALLLKHGADASAKDKQVSPLLYLCDMNLGSCNSPSACAHQ